MTGCFLALGLICFFIGIMQIFTPSQDKQNPIHSPAVTRGNFTFHPNISGSTIHEKSNVSSDQKRGQMEPTINSLTEFSLGDRIRVSHPVQGELSVHILGICEFSELWQQVRGNQSPWVPTGNKFKQMWLESNILLLNWQTRYYLLDEGIPTNDSEIQRDFAPHARQFAQSDQTAEVLFSYPPAMWRIVDIGKFRIEGIQGNGFRSQTGGIGRFIHTSGDNHRALVLEDYEGGSGQDMVWIGYQIEADSIQKE